MTALAASHHLPAIYLFRAFAPGGLIVYGPDYADLLRHSADYVDKILRGTKPADLPVEQPTKYELIINVKDRQSARSHRPALVTRPRRRGDRIEMRFAAAHESGNGP